MSSTKKPDSGEHGIWAWNGESWDELQSNFKRGKAPFDPNASAGVSIRGSTIGQRLIFPLQIVVGRTPKPYSALITVGGVSPLDDYCICQCQNNVWVPVEDYCPENCDPVCGFSDGSSECENGQEEIGGCDCTPAPPEPPQSVARVKRHRPLTRAAARPYVTCQIERTGLASGRR